MPDADREVYLASKGKGPGRKEYVLAVVSIDPADRVSFDEEVRRCLDLSHPAIAKMIEAFEDEDGRMVVVTEFLEGMTLHRLLRYLEEQNEVLGDGAVLHVGVALMEALSDAHGRRVAGRPEPVVHGQLGPHQVLITWDGEIKILGFGLSTVFRRAVPPAWLTPYTAPEVRGPRSNPTPRANAYTAAAMLWSLLGRRSPRDNERPESLRRLRPELKAAIAHPIDRALDPRPAKRVSCKSVAIALKRLVEVADREELRWALEVCRVRCTVAEEFFPTASFPPSQSELPPGSLPPSNGPESDRPTEKYSHAKLMQQARLFGALPWEESADGGARDDGDRDLAKPTRTRPSPAATPSPGASSSPASSAAPGSTGAPRPSEPAPRSRRRTPSVVPRARSYGRPRMATLVGGTYGALTPPEASPPADRSQASSGASASTTMLAPPNEAPASDREGWPGYRPAFPGQPMYVGGPISRSAYPSAPPPAPYASPASQPAPGAYRPHGSHAPQGGYAPPGSYAPQGGYTPQGSYVPYPESQLAPGSIYAPAPSSPPKWLAAIAVTAVLSFVLGVLIASGGIEIRFAGDAPVAAPERAGPEPAEAVEAAPAPVPISPPEPSKPPEAPLAAKAPEPIAEVSAPVEAPVDLSSTEAADLPLQRGLLLVESSQDDAIVYIQGREVGSVNQKIEVECGVRFLRLGTSPLTRWYTPGRAYGVACQALTTIKIEPHSEPVQRRRSRTQFLKR